MRRVSRIAPFLFVDSNNLAFVAGNQIEWMVNALTTTDMYPYSFREMLGDKADERAIEPYPERVINYGEDSVKITVNAFTGETHFYKMTRDPIIDAWDECYPACSNPPTSMPEPVREQLNYPLQWFHIQFDDIYKRYHMTDPLEFYNVEDLWDDADDVLGSLGRGLEEYGTRDEMTFSYEGFNALIDPSDLPAGAVAGPPGELQYAMMMPFTPEGGRNMRALIIALQDPKPTGSSSACVCRKANSYPDPSRRTRSSTRIRRSISRSRSGSATLRKSFAGTRSCFPSKGDLIYIEPLWISSIQNHLPELKLYSVVYRGRCVMATSLEKAIEYLDMTEAEEQGENELPWFETAQKEGSKMREHDNATSKGRRGR